MVVGCVTEKTWVPTKKWVYSVVPRQKDAFSTILDTFIKLGVKKIACIYVDAAMGQNAREALEWAAKQKGLEITIVEKYSLGTSDVSPQVMHVKSSGADALFIAGYTADAAMVVKTAKSLGFKGPIAGDQAVIGPEFIKLVGADGEGFLTTAPKAIVAHDLKDDDIQKKIAVALHDTYTQKYGTFVLGSAHGWDSMNLVTSALRKVDPKLDPSKPSDVEQIREQIRDNLEKLGEVIGQNGTYRITPENHNGLPPNSHIMLTLKDGTWKQY